MKRFYRDGKIITMGNSKPQETMLCEDGKITMVGSFDDISPFAKGAAVISLDGATVLPGFIDPHSHFSQVASGMTQVSLDGAVNCDDIRRRIQRFIREHGIKPGEWVLAKDYDHNTLPNAQHPSLAEIDSFSPGHPLMIQHKSGHMGLFNSAALTQLGITETTSSPDGGRIGKTDGRLNGYVEENAFFFYTKKVPMAGPEQLLQSYREAQQKYAGYGITTIQEGYFVKEMIPLYQMLLSQNLLRLDLVAFPDVETFSNIRSVYPDAIHTYQDHFKLGGLKIFLDGSPQGRTAWMRTPYLGGDPNDCGYGTMRDEDVIKALELSGKNNAQLLAHCNGDAAAAQLLRCLETVEKEYPQLRALRTVIIHAQLMGIDQLPKAATLGAIASFFVAHVYYWGDIHIKNFGMERASMISPAASALQVGLPFTFHQDAPVIEPNMLETIWCAVNRKTKSGVLLGADERISTFDALKAVTVNVAYQYFEEHQKGTLEPGKREDLVILDKNPLECTPETLRDIQVLKTIKDGVEVYTR